MEPLWHLHRDDFHVDKNTVRGFMTYLGDAQLVVQTVENLGRRIAAGDYECVRDYWHGGSMPTWEIIWPHDEDGDGMPDRDRLLFHPANTVRNVGGELTLLGCIAPGTARVDNFWEAGGKSPHPLAAMLPGVSASRAAFANFEATTGKDTERFVLRITEGITGPAI